MPLENDLEDLSKDFSTQHLFLLEVHVQFSATS